MVNSDPYNKPFGRSRLRSLRSLKPFVSPQAAIHATRCKWTPWLAIGQLWAASFRKNCERRKKNENDVRTCVKPDENPFKKIGLEFLPIGWLGMTYFYLHERLILYGKCGWIYNRPMDGVRFLNSTNLMRLIWQRFFFQVAFCLIGLLSQMCAFSICWVFWKNLWTFGKMIKNWLQPTNLTYCNYQKWP